MYVRADEAGGPGPATEATLFRQAQAGCSVSLNALMAHHDGLVQAVVRQQVLGDLPFAEALQAGRIGLWQAMVGFDPGRGLAFSTYAWPCIMHQVWRAVKNYLPLDPPPVMGDGRWAVEAVDPAALWEAAAVRQALHGLVHSLPQRLRQVIVARYGLDGTPPIFYRQLGAAWGLSGERVRQLHSEALVWLRHPAHSQYLRSLLERHTLADYEAAEVLAQRWLRQRGGRRER